ncbi:hypothetical protein SRHO_G00275980 [Serrasalmus rhombeus]
METQSQASSAAEKKKKVETIVATKSSSSSRADISEKAVASSTTSNGTLHTQPSTLHTDSHSGISSEEQPGKAFISHPKSARTFCRVACCMKEHCIAENSSGEPEPLTPRILSRT